MLILKGRVNFATAKVTQLSNMTSSILADILEKKNDHYKYITDKIMKIARESDQYVFLHPDEVYNICKIFAWFPDDVHNHVESWYLTEGNAKEGICIEFDGYFGEEMIEIFTLLYDEDTYDVKLTTHEDGKKELTIVPVNIY